MFLSMLMIWAVQILFRQTGLNITNYILYCLICCGFTGWAIPICYLKAPSFIQPYFFSIGVLTILGFIGSFMIFKEMISLYNYVGIVLTIIGSVLIIL